MIEFFNHHSNLTLEGEMAKVDNNYVPVSGLLDENTTHRIMLILISDRRTRDIVMKMKLDGLSSDVEIIKQFKVCNWDVLDALPDITDEDKMNFEYVDCGSKGANRRCPFSKDGDPKPYCIVKTRLNIPQYAESCANRRRIA